MGVGARHFRTSVDEGAPQLSEASTGQSANHATSPCCRANTARHNPSGSSVNTSLAKAGQHHPGAHLQFTVELLGAPPGVAVEDPHLRGRRGHQRGVLVEIDGLDAVDRFDDLSVGCHRGHQTEADQRLGVDRAAAVEETRLDEGHPGVDLDVQGIAGSVDHQSEGTTFVVVQHEHHGSIEVRIAEGRCGHQQATPGGRQGESRGSSHETMFPCRRVARAGGPPHRCIPIHGSV